MTVCNFQVGDLVRHHKSKDIGVVRKVDKDYHGARQAFKVYGAKRGQAIHGGMVNGMGATEDGIRDRLLVLWTTDYTGRMRYQHDRLGYFDSKDVENVKEM